MWEMQRKVTLSQILWGQEYVEVAFESRKCQKFLGKNISGGTLCS